jgi:hypothetical protein
MPQPFNLVANLLVQADAKSIATAINSIRSQCALLPNVYTLRVAVNNASLGQLQNQLRSLPTLFSPINTSIVGLTQSVDNLTRAMGALAAAQAQLRNTGAAGGNPYGLGNTATAARGLAISLRTISTLTGQVATLAAAYRGLRDAQREALQYEVDLARYAQVGNTSLAGARPMGKTIRETAIQTGVNSDELLKHAVTLRGAGLPEDDVKDLTGVISKLSQQPQIGGSMDAAIKMVLAYRNVWHLTGDEIEKTFETLIAMTKQTTSKMSDMAEGTTRVMSVFKQLGGQPNELASLFAAVQSKTQQPAEIVGTGLKTILTRISSQKSLQTQLRDYGADLFPNNRFVGAMPALEQIGGVLNRLPRESSERTNLLANIGGLRQANMTASLFDSLPEARRLSAVSGDSSGGLTRDSITAQQTLANQITKTKESLYQLFQTLNNSTGLRSLTSDILSTTRALSFFAERASSSMPVVGGLLAGAGLSRMANLPAMQTPITAANLARPSTIGMGLVAGYALSSSMLGGNDSPTSQALGSGAGTALALGGVNPILGALAGTVVALKTFTSATETASKGALDFAASQSAAAVQRAARVTGTFTSPESLSELEGAMGSISAQARQVKPPTGWESYWAAVGTTDAPYQAGEKLSRQRRQAVTDRAAGLTDSLLATRDEILGKDVGSLDAFKKFGGGVGQQIIDFSHLVPGLANFEKIIEQLIAAKQKELETTKQLTDTVGNVVGGMSHNMSLQAVSLTEGLQESKHYLPADVGRYAPRFNEGLTHTNSEAFPATVERLPIEQESKEMLGEVSRAFRELPDILSNTTADTNFADSILDQLRQSGFGEQITVAVGKQLHSFDTTGFAKSLQDLDGTTGKLLGDFAHLVESTRRLGSVMDEVAARDIKDLSTAFDLKGQTAGAFATAGFAQLAATQSQYNFLHNGRPLPGMATKSEAIVERQATSLTGTANVDTIAGTLKGLTEKVLSGDKNPALALQINATVAALRLLSDSATRLKGAHEELTQAENNRKAKLSVLEGYFGADRQGRFTIRREMNAAQTGVKQGSILGMNIQSQQLAVAGLKRVAGVDNVFGSGHTGQELLDGLMKGAAPGMFKADDDKIKSLQDTMGKTMADAAKAQGILAENEKSLYQWHVGALNTTLQGHLSGLAQIMGAEGPAPNIGNELGPAPQLLPGTLPAPKREQPQGVAAHLPAIGLGFAAPEPARTVEERRARSRAQYINERLTAGAPPESLAKFGESLGFNPKSFTGDNRQYLETEMSLRGKGYSTEDSKAAADQAKEWGENTKRQEEAAKTINKAVIDFGQKVDQFAETVKLIPDKTSVEMNTAGHIDVVLNGAECLSSMVGTMKELIADNAASALRRFAEGDQTKPDCMRV